MTTSHGGAPSYHLYGELDDLPDIVHCEAIATRSVLHDWTIKPHRHDRLHQFFVIQSGGGTFNIDDESGRLSPPLVLNIPPRHVHGFMFTAGTKGWVVTVPVEVLDYPMTENLGSLLATPQRLAPNPTVIGLFDQIAFEYAGSGFARNHILHSLVMQLCGQLARTALEDKLSRHPASESPLVLEFEALVEQNYQQNWSLGHYASELAVTPTHLTRLTKQHAGVPASKIIEGRVIQAARRELAYTNTRISDISYDLGYSDPAHFSRVFARVTGMTPSAFRKKIQDDTQ